MNAIYLIGYSGHAFVIADIALNNGYTINGYFDIQEKQLNPYKLKYCGSEENIEGMKLANKKIFVAIGDNKIRQKISKKLVLNNELVTLIHPKAIVGSHTSIGDGTALMASVTINALSTIGKGVICNTGAVIEHECFLADYCHIAPGAVLAGNVRVGERSFVGANAVIKQGVVIGDDVIIGAGSVILNDVANNSIVYGNPGKIKQ